MKLIVQKFGGTSVKTAESRQLAIGHINNALKKVINQLWLFLQLVVQVIPMRRIPY